VAIRYGIGAAAAALICCVAPAVLVLFGLMGGVAALSFTGWFYNDDGSSSWAGWLLRGVAVGVGLIAILVYRRKQNQCSVDKTRRRKNMAILIASLVLIGATAFLMLDRASTAVFDAYITPMQQREYITEELALAREAHARGDREGVVSRLAEASLHAERAATFKTKSGAVLFDAEELRELRAPIETARRELTR
jgi:hypothetical protein